MFVVNHLNRFMKKKLKYQKSFSYKFLITHTILIRFQGFFSLWKRIIELGITKVQPFLLITGLKVIYFERFNKSALFR